MNNHLDDHGMPPPSLPFWHRLPVKLGGYAVLIGLTLGIVLSLVQVASDFRHERASINTSIEQLMSSLEETAAEAAYQVDEDRGRSVLSGLFVFPAVYRGTIIDEFGNILVEKTRGERPREPGVIARFLVGEDPQREIVLSVSQMPGPVGKMKVWLNLNLMAVNFTNRVWLVVAFGIVRNLVLATLLAFVFYLAIAKPLVASVRQIQNRKDIAHPQKIVDVPAAHANDELGLLLMSMNSFFADRERAEEELRKLNEDLEERVEERTGALSQEISERKRAEQILHDAIESVRDGIVLYDANRHFVLCNEQYRKDREKVADMLVPSATIDDLCQAVAERGVVDIEGLTVEEWIARQRKRFDDMEHSFEQYEAGGRTVLVSPYRTKDGGIFIVRTDITERNKTEMHLRQAQKMESLGILAGGISHSFNNLLLPILALSGVTLNRLPENSPERENLEKIILAAERAGDLVQRIMAFGRQDSPKVEIVILHDVVREALDLLAGTIPKTIRIEKSLDQDTGAVMADKAQVEASLMNLVSNAVDAIDGASGTIKVSLSRVDINATIPATVGELHTGAYAKLAVSDNGPGMDDETRNRIFDPFFTTKGVGEGTGLGLSVTQGVVTQYGGAMSVSSARNEGTVVEVYWPLATDRQIH